MARFAFLDSPLPLAFAHRGGAAAGRENTMAAFGEAVALGYRYLETDVHATKDGRVVAFHDKTLDRVTDGAGAIADLTWDRVSRARIAGEHGVPLLEDLLDAYPDVRLNIDAKADSAVGPLVRAIRRTGCLDRVCIGSFSDARLARVRRELGPRLCTSLGPRGVLRLRTTSLTRQRHTSVSEVPCAQVPPRFAGIPVVDHTFVRAAHARGMQVHVWTIDDQGEMNRLLDLGVDGIMTDEPEILRDVLLARGQWSY